MLNWINGNSATTKVNKGCKGEKQKISANKTLLCAATAVAHPKCTKMYTLFYCFTRFYLACFGTCYMCLLQANTSKSTHWLRSSCLQMSKSGLKMKYFIRKKVFTIVSKPRHKRIHRKMQIFRFIPLLYTCLQTILHFILRKNSVHCCMLCEWNQFVFKRNFFTFTSIRSVALAFFRWNFSHKNH